MKKFKTEEKPMVKKKKKNSNRTTWLSIQRNRIRFLYLNSKGLKNVLPSIGKYPLGTTSCKCYK